MTQRRSPRTPLARHLAVRQSEGAPTSAPAEESRRALPIRKDGQPRLSKLAPFADRIGILPDAEVAALAGSTLDAVYQWRKRRGIPPAGRPGLVAPVPPPRPQVRAGAFLVVADDGSEFVILGDDVAGAAAGAVERLTLERPGARVVTLRYLADFLDDRRPRT